MADTEKPTKDLFRVVFLCTANQARSAIAQECTRKIARNLPIEVTSAGVKARSDQPAIRNAITAATALGIDLSAHRSTCLSDAALTDADLVIGFELQHVSAAVIDGSASPESAFTLKEFIRLANGEHSGYRGVSGAKELVKQAHDRRVRTRTFVPGEEIADPVGREPSFFDESFAQICSLCEQMVSLLFSDNS